MHVSDKILQFKAKDLHSMLDNWFSKVNNICNHIHFLSLTWQLNFKMTVKCFIWQKYFYDMGSIIRKVWKIVNCTLVDMTLLFLKIKQNIILAVTLNQDRIIFADFSVNSETDFLEFLKSPFSIQILTAVKNSQNYILNILKVRLFDM